MLEVLPNPTSSNCGIRSVGVTQRKRRVVVPMMLGGMFFCVAYVLSYAPVYRYFAENVEAEPRGVWRVYVPVNWLIDRTPLRGPLLAWADLWGVGFEFDSASEAREFFREVRSQLSG
jgi:hypothetical protein